MAQTRTRGTAATVPQNARTDRRLIAVVLIVAVLAGYTGWVLDDVGHGKRAVSVDRTFTGVINVISVTKDAGCVAPDGGGKQVCSDFAVVPGTTVDQGARVSVAHEWYPNNGGGRTDLLVLYPPAG